MKPCLWFDVFLYQQIDTSVTHVASFRSNSTFLYCNSTNRLLCKSEMEYVLLFVIFFLCGS